MPSLNLPINIPTPPITISPNIIKQFPPKIPSFVLPKIPPVIATATAKIKTLVVPFQKLAGVVQGLGTGQTVSMTVKAGGQTLFSQTLPALSVPKQFLTPVQAAAAKASGTAGKAGSL